MANITGEKKKILLVDDDEIHLTTAELFLKDEYEIHKTQSGAEALEFLQNNKPAPKLIMLDVMMPNMNGWEVFKKIRAIDFLKNIPIVFLTSEDDEEDKKRAQKLGAADYIIKPFNFTDLKRRIKDVITKTK
ncbi:MAG: response regulator [Treponema sp.]|nr:response regulator [Treponema sp.]